MFGSFWDIGWVDTRVKRFPFPLSFLDIARVVSNFRKCVLWGFLPILRVMCGWYTDQHLEKIELSFFPLGFPTSFDPYALVGSYGGKIFILSTARHP